MLLIAFTTQDLAKVSFRGFDPWTEAVLSIRVLRDSGRAGAFGEWRRTTAGEIAGRGLGPELHVLAKGAPQPPDDGPLREALDCYRAFAIEPYRRRIAAVIEAELQARAKLLMQSGHAMALDGLGSHTRWSGSVLEARSAEPGEVRLGGGGLVLQPSFFCPPEHVLLTGPQERPVLVYPVRQSAGAPDDLAEDDAPRYDLGALLGVTRATALEAISDRCSTTELARRLHTSLATASQHAAVLRETGLVATSRCGRKVEHTLTPLGERLLITAAGAAGG
ncbi:ArsR/SmtB family transcription factor [Wenjunlia tyrosinilytica]|uniref:ArsR/SmtB family transcription factor n=1 Tax=Wenjunlia tyrosinilytica TaxID=1544741 RepID=UPI00166A829A|nr:winged helix-turn-helix domain-containing protein [Wenjunlia tyrosinilytica]